MVLSCTCHKPITELSTLIYWYRGYKTFFMLNSAQHEIFSAIKYDSCHFSYLLAEKFSCSIMFSKKEFAIVSNLRFISKTNFMLS